MRVFLAYLLLSQAALAAPGQFTHQGRLLDSDGMPLEDEVTITFRLTAAETGGDLLWEEPLTVSLTNGFYSAILGADEDGNPIDIEVLSQAPVWLELQLDGEPAMFPRSPVHSVPYAAMATVAEEVAGGPVDAETVAVGGVPVINEAGEWVGPASSVSWSDIEGMPEDFADGVDDDTDTDSDSLAELATSCVDGDIPVWDGVVEAWACDFDQDTLAGIGCLDGQLIHWSGDSMGWVCADDVDTLLTEEDVDSMVADNGYAMASEVFSSSFLDLADVPAGLEDGDDDSLAGISCSDGQVLLYSLSSGGWACGTDNDTTLSSAEVQAMVESMAALALGAGTTIGGESPLLESSTLPWSQLGGVPDDLVDGDDDAFAEVSCTDGEFLTVEAGAWVCAPFDGDGDGVPVWTDCDDDDTSLGSRITDSNCDAEEDSDSEPGGTVMYGDYRVRNSVDLANLAGYTEVTGELEIQAGAIPNIDVLTSLTTVGGDFFIKENNTITNLDGLENLTSVGGRFEIRDNASLTDTSGLHNLASIGSLQISGNASLIETSGFERLSIVEGYFYILANRSLTTIGGFESLTEIGGRLYLGDSPEITNLDGFSELTTIGDNMNIEEVHSLTNLDAFSNLTSVGDYLRVYDNDSLNDIDGLSGIAAPSGSNLNIQHNPNLCQSLVDVLVDLIGSWFSTGVSTGGNDSSC